MKKKIFSWRNERILKTLLNTNVDQQCLCLINDSHVLFFFHWYFCKFLRIIIWLNKIFWMIIRIQFTIFNETIRIWLLFFQKNFVNVFEFVSFVEIFSIFDCNHYLKHFVAHNFKKKKIRYSKNTPIKILKSESDNFSTLQQNQ